MKKKMIDIDYCTSWGGGEEIKVSALAEKVRLKIKEGWQPKGPPFQTKEGLLVQKIVKYEYPGLREIE